jgi:hypothetical protein
MRIVLGLLKAWLQGVLVMAVLAVAAVACAHKPLVKTEVVELPVTKFVPIDAKLLVPCVIATGPLSEVIDVARRRKESLETCNGQLDAIRKLQEDIQP